MEKKQISRGGEATRQQGNNGMPAPPAARLSGVNGATPKTTAQEAVAQAAAQAITITVPLGTPPPGYQTDRLDMRLRPKECSTMHQVLAGLQERHARLDGGGYVQGLPDVVRWILEQAANAG